MVDLQQRLNELDLIEISDMRSDIERRAAQLLASEREHRVDTGPVLPRRRGPVVAVGTATLILAVVAVAALVFRAEVNTVTDSTIVPTATTVTTPLVTTPPVTTPPSTSTTVTNPTTNIRRAGSAEDAGWTTIKGPPVTLSIGPRRLENGLWASLWTGRSWPGPLPNPIIDTAETLWISVDGIEWESKEVPELVGRAVYSVEYDANYSSGAEGQLWVRAAPIDETMPSELWITDDGESWHHVQWDTSVPTQPDKWFRINGISRVGDVLFMTANRTSHSMQLVSTDGGRNFTEVSPFPDDGYATAHWSTDREIRAFVRTPTDRDKIFLWRLTDGLTWDPIGEVTGLPESWVELLYPEWPELTVNWSAEALIAGLWERRCENGVAVSVDGGLSWELIDVNRELSIKPSASYCTTASSQGWFVFQAVDPDEYESGVWVSRNGTDWYYLDGELYGDRRPGTIRTNDYNRYAVPPVE